VQACRYCGLQAESLEAHRRARELDPRIKTSVIGRSDRRGSWFNADLTPG
jgi:hypothetical protein